MKTEKTLKKTIESLRKIGALLSEENHIWFNQQGPEVQEEMNRKFKEYKACKIVFVDNLDIDINISSAIFECSAPTKKGKFDRAKEKVKWKKEVEEELER